MYDLRSDTVTRPSPAMRDAMAQAAVGDDVYGEDPTVNALQEEVAQRFGKEAALFVTSGTQGNLLALLSHCQRGDEYIAGLDAHAYRFEAGGAAVLGSIQPAPIPFEPDGTLDLDRVEQLIKPDDPHFARTRLVCLENTHSGKPLPLPYLDDYRALCDRYQLATHLDGARIFNAAIASGVEVARLAAPFDSVSVCFSKGLGAPMGSALIGTRALIATAHRYRKMLGGGTRQAGIVAAAARYALAHNTERLAEDHARAQTLAARLRQHPALAADNLVRCATNMVFLNLPAERFKELAGHLRQFDIEMGSSGRLVLHLDIDDGLFERLERGLAAWQGR